jgi:FG-GAP-like repeat
MQSASPPCNTPQHSIGNHISALAAIDLGCISAFGSSGAGAPETGPLLWWLQGEHMQYRHRRLLRATLSSLFAAALLWPPQPALAQFRVTTEKFFGVDTQTTTPREGNWVSVTGDGSTIYWSGNSSAWTLTRGTTGESGWDKLNIKAFPKGAAGGASPVVSADGNTVVLAGGIVGNVVPALDVLVRSGGTWTEVAILTGAGVPSQGFGDFGTGVALSANGSTILVGGALAGGNAGAAYVFTNSSGTWTQQAQLAGAGAIGLAEFGAGVALSADGNTALVGGAMDNNQIGAAWVFTRSGGVWTQQAKLVGSGIAGTRAGQGSVALSADGNTALVGGAMDNNNMGAVWVFTRSGGQWTQQGGKLVPTDASGTIVGFGSTVALSADGNTAFIVGPGDKPVGAVWAFGRTGGVWNQMGHKLVPGDIAPNMTNPASVSSVALSADGGTAVIGAPGDNTNYGAVWVITGPRYDTFRVTHDLNHDGTSDIVWRRNDGATAAWLMGSGGQILQQSGFGQVPTNWQLVGQRDFNGDGFCDLLWRDSNTGTVAIWLMNGLTVQQMGTIGVVPNNWVIAGTGDINADGKGDILWRDTNTGTIAVWLMDGFSVLQSIGLGAVPSNWVIAATDRVGDIFWRDTNTGELAVWWAFDQGVVRYASLGVVPLNWVIAGTGDFDSNGATDLLWRDTNTGAAAVWLMDGYRVMTGWGLGTVPLNWSIAETGNFDIAGYSHILWRDSNTGAVALWIMNGVAQQVQSVGIAAVPLEWSILSLNAE